MLSISNGFNGAWASATKGIWSSAALTTSDGVNQSQAVASATVVPQHVATAVKPAPPKKGVEMEMSEFTPSSHSRALSLDSLRTDSEPGGGAMQPESGGSVAGSPMGRGAVDADLAVAAVALHQEDNRPRRNIGVGHAGGADLPWQPL